MALAEVASLRSEDPFRKVGAAALDWDNRVIATAYNGLAPGFDAPGGFWDDRDGRQKYMLHAEVNLCSLFKRGEAKLVATTTMPCTACMQTLCAYGIKGRFIQLTGSPQKKEITLRLQGPILFAVPPAVGKTFLLCIPQLCLHKTMRFSRGLQILLLAKHPSGSGHRSNH
ncbi:hypothetical protein OAE92_03815 [Akkermansiaceae bacterium]|nr:hypothetical protein [Akkermansiaceae bacterium]